RLSGDWSSDVCSSDLEIEVARQLRAVKRFDIARRSAYRIALRFGERALRVVELALADLERADLDAVDFAGQPAQGRIAVAPHLRSEERRVGKECRARG